MSKEIVAADDEFLGLNSQDCCIDCTPARCAIGGSLIVKNDDGTTSTGSRCAHPRKGGLMPIQQAHPVIVARYNRAKKYLLVAEAKAARTE